MPRRRSDAIAGAVLLLAVALPGAAQAKKDKVAPDAFSVTLPEPVPPAPPANGSIFQGGYVPLTSGARAGQVGDILTIQLVERTMAAKSNSAGTTRDGNIGLTPPTTGPLSLFDPSDVAMGGGSQFKGKGEATQSNTLSGEVTVTVAAVYPNGTMLVKGEKLLTLNRGDERVQIAGIVRSADIGPDNRVLSTRVANAHIRYVGKGEIARASQQGWLQRFFSIISPF
ncbi:flagellar basal body L-ring protein FlgH [Sphingopyxis sp. YF1]|uniref:flagellar basal body L-ring protein FlgH n=1 Tax=Sphingopyxis sp. YF1 TaxID=2482763 RepID=UPI001F625FD9|nr:flagellar basal body L-ring protein FlgH [Sphingopyxis sp. YF1]UNU43131.1 flagellar basal body L-ring protein FlgH [Sphingopyxis sp. YF1]